MYLHVHKCRNSPTSAKVHLLRDAPLMMGQCQRNTALDANTIPPVIWPNWGNGWGIIWEGVWWDEESVCHIITPYPYLQITDTFYSRKNFTWRTELALIVLILLGGEKKQHQNIAPFVPILLILLSWPQCSQPQLTNPCIQYKALPDVSAHWMMLNVFGEIWECEPWWECIWHTEGALCRNRLLST